MNQQGVIRKFLADKQTVRFKKDKDKFRDYPIQFVDHDRNLQKGFLQDATETIKGNQYILEVVIMDEAGVNIITLQKSCKAPIGCVIDWDSIHCPYYLFSGN